MKHESLDELGFANDSEIKKLLDPDGKFTYKSNRENSSFVQDF